MKKTQLNSGGPRAGSQSQEIFADLLQFSSIWGGDVADFVNFRKFAPHPQKRLDTRPRCGYNGAGRLFHRRSTTSSGAGRG